MVDPTPTWPPPPDRVLRWGVAVSLLLAALSWVLYLTSDDYHVPELDVGAEGSVAAWASSLALFGGAVAAWSIGRRDRPGRRTSWRALATVFAFLPALVVTLVGVAFVPFLRDLERTTARQLLLAGTVYVGGALGLEAVTGALASSAGDGHWLYGTLATLEELLEMLGITLFLATLARYEHHLVAASDGPLLGRPVADVLELD